MREIKFRAWDKINKRWCKNFKVDLLSIPIHEMPHIVIEQYTGVKDVNNTEIYENDIVETTWWNDKEEKYKRIGIVVIKNGMALIKFPYENEKYEGQSLYHTVDVKVKGNIYMGSLQACTHDVIRQTCNWNNKMRG